GAEADGAARARLGAEEGVAVNADAGVVLLPADGHRIGLRVGVGAGVKTRLRARARRHVRAVLGVEPDGIARAGVGHVAGLGVGAPADVVLVVVALGVGAVAALLLDAGLAAHAEDRRRALAGPRVELRRQQQTLLRVLHDVVDVGVAAVGVLGEG